MQDTSTASKIRPSDGMQFSIGLPTDRVANAEEFLTVSGITTMATEIEGLGYDACWVTDHPAASENWLSAGGHHAFDPFVVLSFAAASTSRLRLHTHILVLAYRNPLLCAKSILSLETISGGRVILGVAAGYLRSEFGALGVDFDERNELTDEAIDVLRLIWTEGTVSYEGRHFRSQGTVMRPRPDRDSLPIWIGGNSTQAIRRAVDLGDGWSPFPNIARLGLRVRAPVLESFEEFERRLAFLHDYAEERGRTAPIEICFSPFELQPAITGTESYDPAVVVDELHRLAALGVTWSVINAPAGCSRAEYLDGAQRFAETVMEPFRSSRDSVTY
jgi:probable F420-dependent oxidoreductase